MTQWQLDSSSYRAIERWVQACPRCKGAWVDPSTLGELVRNASALADARATKANDVPRRPIVEPVVYRHCPSCGQMMHRRNFGRISGVVVDECRKCGTWFDEGELEAVLDFIHAGGLKLSEAFEQREAERQIERSKPPPNPLLEQPRGLGHAVRADLEFELLEAFGRWAARWLRRLGR